MHAPTKEELILDCIIEEQAHYDHLMSNTMTRLDIDYLRQRIMLYQTERMLPEDEDQYTELFQDIIETQIANSLAEEIEVNEENMNGYILANLVEVIATLGIVSLGEKYAKELSFIREYNRCEYLLETDTSEDFDQDDLDYEISQLVYGYSSPFNAVDKIRNHHEEMLEWRASDEQDPMDLSFTFSVVDRNVVGNDLVDVAYAAYGVHLDYFVEELKEELAKQIKI